MQVLFLCSVLLDEIYAAPRSHNPLPNESTVFYLSADPEGGEDTNTEAKSTSLGDEEGAVEEGEEGEKGEKGEDKENNDEKNTDKVSAEEGVNKIQDEKSVASEAGDELPSGPRVLVSVELSNGTVLEGEAAVSQIVSRSENESLVLWILDSPTNIDGSKILNVQQISASKAAETSTNQQGSSNSPKKPKEIVEPSARGFSYRNASSSRYLYSPSSIALKQGEGYISQKEILFTSVAYGVTDSISVTGGTFTFFPPAISIFGGKYSQSISSNIHISVGGELFLTGLSGVEVQAGIVYGGITFGDEDVNISVNLGAGQIFKEWGVPLVVAASYRFSDRFALISENWLVTTIKNSYSWDGTTLTAIDANVVPEIGVASIAGRVLGRRNGFYGGTRQTLVNPNVTVDYGLLMFYFQNETSAMIPWVDWSWNF